MAWFFELQLKEARAQFEREYLTAQLRKFSGNVSKVAIWIGMERGALIHKLKKLGISVPEQQSMRRES